MEFGAGLPSGGPDGLSWNRHGTLRSYHKPWLVRQSTDDEEGEDSPDSNFMPTRMGLLLDNNNSAASHVEDDNKGKLKWLLAMIWNLLKGSITYTIFKAQALK